MSDTMVVALLKDMIKVALMVSGPILITATVVGLLISIFQATTQIQEQTLTFVPKILAVAVVGLLTASWMGNQLISFTKQIFSIISNIGA
ncbi:flagellar biosynthesis protein FliQ [Clostridium tunisiense]|uniref:flagellar biosynthesis protein FliQ n=1 Tax=Clostridium tunisiense TaxID=219748 RepID=UPI00030C29D4|nr:flagellar biosynthesis protein FliQ [Clostridium tunisiense]